MIVAGAAGFEERFDANRYTPTSKQRRIVPTIDSWMSLCCCDIMPFSFIKDGSDRTPVQGSMHVVFLSALSRDQDRVSFRDKYITYKEVTTSALH